MRQYAMISGVLVTMVLTAGLAGAGDWMQWRGPELNGSTDETNLPTDITKAENTAWKVAMPGPGGSTPIVVGDRIFTTSRKTEGQDLLGMCISLKDGKTIWSKVMSSGKPSPRAIASCSPASDGKSVYFLFGTGDLCATDLDGKILWSRKLAADYGPFAVRFGYSASPLLRKGRLYIPLLRTAEGWPYTKGMDKAKKPLDSLILCLESASGKTIWTQKRHTDAKLDCKDTYITPMVVEVKRGPELIMCGGEYVTGHNIDTGKELWRWEYTKTREVFQRIVSCPVIVDGLVITNQALGRGTFALKPGGSGRIKHTDYAWKWTEGASADVCSPLIYQGSLYILPDRGKKKVITCLDPKTGKVKWQHEFKGKGPWRASPTGADGKIYCISKGGTYVVLEAGDKFKELHRSSVDAKVCFSTIVAAHGRLLIRTDKEMICLKKPQAAKK